MIVQRWLHLGGGKSAVDFIVDDDHRCQGAGAEAGHPFHTELVVVSGVAGLDAQVPLYGFHNLLSTAHVAGRTQANLDDVFGRGSEAELGIKRSYPEDLALRDSEELSYLSDALF